LLWRIILTAPIAEIVAAVEFHLRVVSSLEVVALQIKNKRTQNGLFT